MTRIDFAKIEQDKVETSAGTVGLPILYHDVSIAQAMFAASYSGARELLEPLGLRPLRLPGGRALAGMAFYEYRDTTVGAYNEVATVVACTPTYGGPQRLAFLDMLRPARRRRVGFAVVDLPVTTEIARAGGREIWGYPKFVTEIPISWGERFEGEVLDPAGEQSICTLSGSPGAQVRAPGFDLVTYTSHHGRPWRTVVDVEATFAWRRAGDVRLVVGDSNHPMAANLRVLGLHGRRPLVFAVSHDWKSVLHRGAPA